MIDLSIEASSEHGPTLACRAFGVSTEQRSRRFSSLFTWNRIPSRSSPIRSRPAFPPAGMQRLFNDSIRRSDPDALVGFNCAPYGVNPFHGFNRPLIGRDADFAIEYQPSWLEDKGVSSSLELLADSSPHMKIGFYIGYNYMDLDPNRYWFKTWWMAFRGLYGPFYYTVMNDAYNDAKGSWELHVRDVMSGKPGELRVQLK